MDRNLNMPLQHMPPHYDNNIPRTQNRIPGTWLPQPHVSSNRNPNEMSYNIQEHSARSSIASKVPDDGYQMEPNLSLDSDSAYGLVISPGQVHMDTSPPEVSTISHDANLKKSQRTHSTRHILLAVCVATLIIIGIVGVAVTKVLDGPSAEKQFGPVDGIWSNWYEWGQCSATCGDGTITLTRICNNPPPSDGGQDCGNLDTNATTCKVVDCSVDGQWAYWQSWSQCSETCGLGTRTRNRTCENPRPKHNGDDCFSEGSESSSCNNSSCSPTGFWGTWTGWNDCSVTCGKGVSNRSRVCNESRGGECTGSDTNTMDCQTRPCYDSWGDWSACSLTCGTGSKTRNRTCNGRYKVDECGNDMPTFLDRMSCSVTPTCEDPFCQNRAGNCTYRHPNRCDMSITCDAENTMSESVCNVLTKFDVTEKNCTLICNHAASVQCP